MDVCYKVPLAVNNTYKLIVEHDVTHAVTEQEPRATMAKRAQDTLATEQIDAGADRGDYHGDAVKQCREAGILPSISKPHTSAKST
jgi:hypothetical protein